MRRLISFQLTALAILTCVLTGCGHKQEARAPLRGKVTCRGVPLKMGRVNFSNAALGVHLTADIDPSGNYEVRSYRGVGIPPGTYQVTVLPSATADMNDKNAASNKFSDIPEKYRGPTTSDLKCTVVEGQDNQYDIDLTEH